MITGLSNISPRLKIRSQFISVANCSAQLSDFIIYLEDKKELINLVVDISDLKYTEDELNDNIDNYFDVIKESLYNNQIVKLTSELKNESNSVKKMEIAQKIVDLKIKESNKDE